MLVRMGLGKVETNHMEYMTFPSPMGEMLIVARENAIAGVYFVGQKYAPAIPSTWSKCPDNALLQRTRTQLLEYFDGNRQTFDLPVHPVGTLFQRAVWDTLGKIPFGTTTTYGRLAETLGGATKTRAVGTAIGRNPCSIVIPCHRVLGADGSPTGYAGGLERKRALLALENIRVAESQLELNVDLHMAGSGVL